MAVNHCCSGPLAGSESEVLMAATVLGVSAVSTLGLFGRGKGGGALRNPAARTTSTQIRRATSGSPSAATALTVRNRDFQVLVLGGVVSVFRGTARPSAKPSTRSRRTAWT